jgi:hypothetical protein
MDNAYSNQIRGEIMTHTLSPLPLVVMLVLAPSVPAQDKSTQPSPLTDGYFNGQVWRGFSPDSRFDYFAGYMDALAARKLPSLFEGCHPCKRLLDGESHA